MTLTIHIYWFKKITVFFTVAVLFYSHANHMVSQNKTLKFKYNTPTPTKTVWKKFNNKVMNSFITITCKLHITFITTETKQIFPIISRSDTNNFLII